MNDDIEFNILHIYLGTLVPIMIFKEILESLYIMFNNLGLICIFIVLIIYINVGFIVCNELRIWAKCCCGGV